MEQLEAYLNFEDVSQAVSRPKATKQHHLITFEDRLAFQSSPLYHIHQDALQIHVYLDEVSMTGDRGSRSKKKKLVYVKFSFGNLKHTLVLILRGNTGFSLVFVTRFEEKPGEKHW